jgi:hypothetical protein
MLRYAWADAKGAVRTAMLAFALTSCGLVMTQLENVAGELRA